MKNFVIERAKFEKIMTEDDVDEKFKVARLFKENLKIFEQYKAKT